MTARTHGGGSGTVTGAGGLSTGPTSLTYTGNRINAGAYFVTAHYAGDANHFGSDGAAVPITIGKASSTTTIVAPGGTYNGLAFLARGAVNGAGGLSIHLPMMLMPFSYVGAGATSYGPSPAAPTKCWLLRGDGRLRGDMNHNASSSSVPFTISKANSITGVTATASTINNHPAESLPPPSPPTPVPRRQPGPSNSSMSRHRPIWAPSR